MKKSSSLSFISFTRVAVLFLAILFSYGNVKAQQVLADWPLHLKSIPAPAVPPGPIKVATGVTAGTMTGPSTFGGTLTTLVANQGLKLKQNFNWPTSPDPTNIAYSLDFPISPASGNDLIITGLTLADSLPTASNAADSLAIAPYYQIDGSGNWIPLATPQHFPVSATTSVNFGSIDVPFFLNSKSKIGHTYKVRLCIFSPNGAVKGDYFYLASVIFYGKVQTATTTPSVTTTIASATGKYSATVIGKYDFGATYQNPTIAGVTWSTAANPTITTSSFSTDGSGGIINSSISGLTAGTIYHTRAFIVTPIDTIYDASELTFTTDPTTPPNITATAAMNVLSNKATIGAMITDSGGLPITDKYIKYGTSSISLTNIIRPSLNSGSDAFTVLLTQLQPNTKYYYEACATNSQGTNCGSVESFTTTIAVPVLTANPSVIDFGDIVYNSTAPIISFALNGKYLKAGTITINISPASGFVISTSPTKFPATPVSSITIPCGDGDFKKAIPIYIKLLTGNYLSYASKITLSEDNNKVDPKNTDTVLVTGNIIPSPDQLSNMGTDFWTGFAYENNMSSAPTDAAAAQMSVYIAAGDKDAVVNVELPGIPGAIGFPQTSVKIPAHTVKEITGFPIGTVDEFNKGNGPDSRLYYTGISKRGVHVTSTNGIPVAVWMHTYTTNNSAGATMVFPTNTWGASYAVQGYGGQTNSGKASSFFFVMAKEDGTEIEFTPSNDIVDSSKTTIFQEGNVATDVLYAKGQTYKLTLNKGEIFNAMAFVQGTGGNSAISLDLSGTTVKTTDCSKKIAVFAGSGRVLVATKTGLVGQGSDNLVQQMFPKVAWGTKYLTVPTKTMEYNVYRINVEDSTTKVWVNNSVHTVATALPKSQYNSQGQYYPIEGNQPNIIESDKPISVTQFIIAGSAPDGKNKTTHPTIGNGGLGDPEMIILSPVQQAINSATVYSSNFKNNLSGGSYINVVIKNTGIDSFKLDGKQTADTGISSYSTVGVPGIYGPSATPNLSMKKIFKVHPGDPNYSYAMFKVESGKQHTITSNVAFNAIAYGMDDGESYGYNAGTAINNLSSVKIALNPFGQDTSSTVIKTCKNNLVTLEIALPYSPSLVDSIIWSAPVNSNINLSGESHTGPFMTDPINGKKYADTTGSIVVGGQTFYIYKCPVQYQFSDNGFYPIIATAFGKFASECSGTDAQKFYVQVSSDNIDFKVSQKTCTSTSVTILDSSTGLDGTSIVKWSWDLGDNSVTQTYTDPINHNPTPSPYTYASLSSYKIKLSTINSVGCSSIDSLTINLANGINAGFTKDNDTICPNASVTFTDTSSATADKRVWDFGEPGSANNQVTNPTVASHTYTTPGKHYITLQVFAGVCPSNFFKDSVYVSALPKADFTYTGVCLPGITKFVNKSDTTTGFVPYSYLWNFGDSTNNIPNTATTTDGVHTYLAASKNPNGYKVQLIATNRFGCVDTASYNVTEVYNKPKAIIGTVLNTCFGDSTIFSDASTVETKQTINKWKWNFGDAAIDSIKNPKHKYATVNGFTATLIITTDKQCSDTTTAPVKINPLPVPGIVTPSSCFVQGGGPVTFTNKATIADDGTQLPLTLTWSYTNGGAMTPSLSNGDGQYTYTTTGTFPVKQNVVSNNGCAASKTIQFEIVGSKPSAAFSILNANNLCSNIAVQLQDASTNKLGGISRIDIIWDTVNNPSTLATYKTLASTYSNNYLAAPTDANFYVRLIATCGSTCSDTAKAQLITVHGSPTITFNVTPASICASDASVKLTGASETSGPPNNVINPDPGFTYTGLGVSGSTFDPTKAVVGNNPIVATYTTQAGCKATASSNILVKSSVDLSFSPNKLFWCKSDSLQLNPISGVGQSFTWSESDAPLNTFKGDNTVKKPWVQPVSDSTVYILVATNPNYCSSLPVSFTVLASPHPDLTILRPASKDTIICIGDKAFLSVASKAASIVWTPVTGLASSTSFATTASPLSTITYKATVKDTFYCKKAISDFITVHVQPAFAINVVNTKNDSDIAVPGEPMYLHAYVVDSSDNFKVYYVWKAAGLTSDLKYLSSTTTSDPIFTATSAVGNENLPYIHYTVIGTSKGGCRDTTDYAVKVFNALPDLLVPTAFINDGRNRNLTPVPVGITKILYFRVYNRMGQLVFNTTDIAKGWDGIVNGSPAEVGTYVWMAQGVDYKGVIHQPQTGTVVLIR